MKEQSVFTNSSAKRPHNNSEDLDLIIGFLNQQQKHFRDVPVKSLIQSGGPEENVGFELKRTTLSNSFGKTRGNTGDPQSQRLFERMDQ
jgi:hypothetical protein